MFAPLEHVFAAKRQPFFRKEWLTDFAFHLFQTLLWTKLTLFSIEWLHHSFNAFIWIMPVRNLFSEQNLFLQILWIVFLSDFLIYWGHRLSHQIPFLWNFHKIHHTAVALDWLAAFREHPFDNIYTRVIVNLPALAMGFSLDAVAGYVIFRGLWGNFIHSNTPFGLGPFKYILGSPRLHHWHHDFDKNSRCNFANLMPVMDVMFGTFYDPGKMPEKYGIDDSISHRYLPQILLPVFPFLRKFFR